MGRKSLTVIGECTFGMSDKSVVFISFRSRPVLKKSSTAEVTSCPTIGHAALKKPDEYPFGPGALSSAMSKTACLASAGVNGNSKAVDYSECA